MRMRTMLQIAAVLSFLSFLGGGSLLLRGALFSPASDAFPIVAVGFVFVGTAFVVGPMLLVAAEKFRRDHGSR